MAARIFRINYKSDFILTMNSEAGWTIPFCIKFWTSIPMRAYYVGFDGTTYIHCALDGEDPTKLHVHFDDHHLPIGDLKFQIAYHFTVEDFPNNTEDEVINQAAVIIDQDGTQMQVMLDLNGETAPEIEFNLPAYANEAQRIANENQRIANEAQRIANEEQRIANEEQRISNEEQRIAAESIRIANEESRISEFAQLKHDAEIATADANAAATLANEKAALAAEKAALSQAAAELANAKATLAQQKADYAQTQGDYAKAQGDYAKEQGDIAEADHERAESDHTRAENDHTAVEVYVDSLGAFDISAYHATGGVLAKYVDLSAALDGGDNIPEAIRKGGMSVKFVQSSDNKYVQYRLMHPLDNASTAADDFTNTANWQGVDDEPTAGSDNLVKSGGVSEKLTELGGEVAENKSDIIELQNRTVRGTDTDFLKLSDQYNLFVNELATANTYINGNTGLEATTSGLSATDYIPVTPLETYYTNSKFFKKYYAFYDENKSYISGDNTTGGFLSQLTIPSGAYYVRLSFSTTNGSIIWFSKNNLDNTVYKYTTNERLVIPKDTSTTELTDIELGDGGNIIDRTKLMYHYYVSATNGSLVSTTSGEYYATDWCSVEGGKTYYWFKILNFYAAFYDENRSFIEGFPTTNRLPNPFIAPSNAKYARFTLDNRADRISAFGTEIKDAVWVYEFNQTPNNYPSYVFPKDVFTEREYGINPCNYDGKEICIFNKIACIGDSLTQGAFNTGSTARDFPNYSWPVILAKITGCDVVNLAHSGYTTQQWYEWQSSNDLSGYDCAIIQIGVNDWLSWSSDTDSAIDTTKNYLGQIVTKLVNENSYNNSGTLINKIKIFVATIPPNKWYLKNSNNVSVEVLNDAIKEFVSDNVNCYLLDMATYSHTIDKLEYQRGHFSTLGYMQLAQDYSGIISRYIADNLNEFVNVAFTGKPYVPYTPYETQW